MGNVVDILMNDVAMVLNEMSVYVDANRSNKSDTFVSDSINLSQLPMFAFAAGFFRFPAFYNCLIYCTIHGCMSYHQSRHSACGYRGR